MEAKDFRIGNSIYYNGKESNITLMDFVLIQESSGEELQYYKPVPLTEDLLLRSGFEKFNDVLRMLIYGGTFLVININDKTALLHQNIDGHTDMVCLNIDFDFYHQLQNLFFSLTGKEIEFK